MVFLKNQDTLLAIMQKKNTNYPRFIHFHRVLPSFNTSKVFIIGLLVCFLASCAHYDQNRIDLKNIDTSSQKVAAKTDLMLAAEAGDSRLLKLALEQGGKINAFTSQDSAFSLALKNGHEAISRILLSAGSDWEAGFLAGQSSALIDAADKGFDDIVKTLIVKAASLEAVDENGYTALARCAMNGHLTTLKILINAGANVNVQPEGRSVLMHVVEKNNMLLSQLLIAAGADLNFSDSDGDTALKIARRNGFFDLDLMLVQADARP
jgi:ankyrin repeat protein